MTRTKAGRLAAGLLAAGFCLRLAYMTHLYHGRPEMPHVDPESYDLMAHSILERGELAVSPGHPLTDREPLYPLVLAASHLVLGRSPWAGLVFNLVFSMAACGIVYLLSRSLFNDESCALTALALACFYPEWVYYTAFLLRETLLTFLLLLWALLWVRKGCDGRTVPYLAMGLICGALGLIRSPMLPLAPAFALLAAWRLPRRLWARSIGAFLFCAFLVQVPWIVRNRLVTGRLVAGASMGGRVMYSSLFVDYDRPEIPLEASFHRVDPVIDRAEAMSQAEADRFYYAACWEVFKHRPGLFWSTFIRKAAKLWRPYPHAGWDYGHPLGLLMVVGLLSTGSLLVLGVAGAWLSRGRPGSDFLVMVPAVMTVVYGLFWAVTRYHAPLMAFLMPLSAWTLCRQHFLIRK